MQAVRVYKTHTKTRRVSRRSRAAQHWSKRARIMAAGVGVAAAAALTATLVAGPAGIRTVTIPAGIRLVAALDRSITTAKASAGQGFTLQTTEPIRLSDGLTLPKGIIVRGEVTHAQGGGRIAGAPELTLRFNEMEVAGRSYPILAEPFRVRGKSDGLESVAEIGGGALVGGVVGAVAGDAAKGAVIGGVVGTGVAVATKGDQIVLPAGQRLRIKLSDPVTVQFSGKPDDSRKN